MSLGSFIGRALSRIGSAFGEEGRLRYHYGDGWRDSARILSQMQSLELESKKNAVDFERELKSAQLVGNKVNTINKLIDMTADSAAEGQLTALDANSGRQLSETPGVAGTTLSPDEREMLIPEQLPGYNAEIPTLPPELGGVMSQEAFAAATKAAGTRRRREWEVENAKAAAAMARAGQGQRPLASEVQLQRAVESFRAEHGRDPVSAAEALSWFNNETQSFYGRTATDYSDPANPKIIDLKTGQVVGIGRPVQMFDAMGIPLPIGRGGAGGGRGVATPSDPSLLGAVTDDPGGGWDQRGADTGVPSPPPRASYIAKPGTPTQVVRERAAGIMQALDVIERDVAPAMAQVEQMFGPLRGRLASIQMDKLGGYGLTQEQVEMLTRLRTLLTSQAFADGGKQLTQTELELFRYTSPSPQDTFEAALTKAKILRKALYSRGRNLILGEAPGARPQLADFAKRLRLYREDRERGYSFDGGSTWLR